jgi:membrane protein DedA with SNARE-associated domain
MEHFFSSTLDSIVNQGALFLYLFLFISAILENLFPPVPGDTVTALGAFLVGTGKLNLGLVFLSTTLGSVIGFFTLFILSRYFFSETINRNGFKWISAQQIASAKERIGKYGYAVILINRFLPGIRSVISITAGLLQMRLLPVFLLSLVSAAFWNALWMAAGYGLGNNWESVKSRLGSIISRYNIVVGIIICAIIVFIAAKKIHAVHKQRKKKKHGN